MPFTTDEFFNVFSLYNAAIWPLPVFAYLSAAIAVGALPLATRWQPGIITVILALMWAVNGIGYHWLHFSGINPAAWLFGAVFLVQATVLSASPFLFPEMRFAVRADARSIAGLALVVFATAAYPAWGRLAGHRYPAMPVFGVAPCPTTIFTVGLLLLGPWRAVRWLLIVPVLWAAVGGSAAILLGVPQDYGLVATMLIVAAFAFGHRRDLAFARHFRE
jgi:hypothetical protein